MYVLQDCFIAFFGFTYKYTKKIPITVRNLIAFLCIFLLTLEFYLLNYTNPIGITNFTLRELTLMGNVLMIVLAVMSVKGELARIRWNKWIVYPYLFTAVYMVFACFHHYPGMSYDAFPLQLLIFFPEIYFVWENRKQYDMYYNWLAKSSFLIGVVLIVVTLLFAPMGEDTAVSGRYCGLTTNPNILAMLLMVSLSGTLFLLRPKTKAALFYVVVVGIHMGLMMLTDSRGGIIVGVMEIAAWAVLSIRREYQNSGMKFVAIVIAFVIGIAACVPVTSVIVNRGRESEITVADTQADVTETENKSNDRFSSEGKDLNTFTSGRIEIWKWYISRFTIFGNDCTEHKVQIDGTSGSTSYAHNTYIEIAYRYGIPAGVSYVFFMCALIVYLIRAALIRGKSSYVLIVVLFSLAYFIESMLEIMTLPFDRGPVTMFYLSLVGVFDNDIMCSGQSDRKGKH